MDMSSYIEGTKVSVGGLESRLFEERGGKLKTGYGERYLK